MRDDLVGLRSSLESGVEPPPFDAVSQRAEATVRRRRTRAVVLATCSGVAAIVVAVAALTTLPGDDDQPHAESSHPPAENTAGPPPGVEVQGGLPAPLIDIDTSAGAHNDTVIELAPQIVKPADRIFIAIAARDGSRTADVDLVAGKQVDAGWTVAPGAQSCSGAEVDPSGTVTLANGCVPDDLTAGSEWTITVETDGGSYGQIFTVGVGDDGRSDGVIHSAKQWPPSGAAE